MLEVRRLADAGETGPMWVQALEQTAGKGRRGRAWQGLGGNVFLTGLVTLEATPQEAANLSFAAALAVAETVDLFVAPQRVRLKWPNDVLIDGIKTSGILLESWPGPAAGLLCVSIGIGLNVAAAPDSARVERPATCIAGHLAPGAVLPTAEQAGVELAARMERWIARWQTGGFAPVRTHWTARAAGLDGPVTARLQDRDIHGTLRGISDTGCLLLEAEGGLTHQISAADVFIPAAAHGTV
jgi:BirA family biotin operon repressor/biotin-[acetyl-CoA-carboxylase] ligase